MKCMVRNLDGHRRLLVHCFTLLAALALGAVPCAAEPSAGDLAASVANLASDVFTVRQRASQLLMQAGPEAIPFLAAAVAGGDGEVRARAMEVLLQHALSPQSERRDPARAALRDLAGAAEPRVARAVQATLHRVREVTASIAAAELARLGATVMPLQGSDPPAYNIQIRNTWSGGDQRLALLGDLGEVPWLSLENAPVTDAALPHVARLTNLTKLYLGSSGITGRSLPDLAPLTRLQHLFLKYLPIDDQKLAQLPNFPELQYLSLEGTRVTDLGLAQLSRFPQLQMLWLDGTPITDAGLSQLRPLAALRTLHLAGTRTAGPGLAELRHLPSLTSLSLKGVPLAADSLKHVNQLEQLESLGLDETNVTDEQLGDLSALSRLRILWLSNTAITDHGLEHLKQLRGLQVLYLSGAQVSSEAAAELQKVLPNCQVTLSGQFDRNAPPRRPPPPPRASP
jgi:hypothetical protein